MTFRDDQSERGNARRPGPWDRPATPPTAAQRPRASELLSERRWTSRLSVIAFVLIVATTVIQAFKDVSRPEAWAYWKDLYFSRSMTSALVSEADLGDLGHRRSALVISGEIGAASASWFRDRLDEAHLVPGDVVLMSSPGGDLEQAVIMGEIIRARGLATAVGVIDGGGKVRPSHCASACVFVFAGGATRFGVAGSRLGVHRFVSNAADHDAVSETQRTTGQILSYLTRMGVSSSSFVEAMSATGDIRWLDMQDARAMNLITEPVLAQ
jgi:hypothetical protein